MSSNNNNTKGLKNIKKCPNHCGTWIAYNERLNRFVEAKSGEIHRCPKWKPDPNYQRKAPYKKIKTLKREEVTQLDPTRLTMEDIRSMEQKLLEALEYIKRYIHERRGVG
jgi:hypothetical protein